MSDGRELYVRRLRTQSRFKTEAVRLRQIEIAKNANQPRPRGLRQLYEHLADLIDSDLSLMRELLTLEDRIETNVRNQRQAYTHDSPNNMTTPEISEKNKLFENDNLSSPSPPDSTEHTASELSSYDETIETSRTTRSSTPQLKQKQSNKGRKMRRQYSFNASQLSLVSSESTGYPSSATQSACKSESLDRLLEEADFDDSAYSDDDQSETVVGQPDGAESEPETDLQLQEYLGMFRHRAGTITQKTSEEAGQENVEFFQDSDFRQRSLSDYSPSQSSRKHHNLGSAKKSRTIYKLSDLNISFEEQDKHNDPVYYVDKNAIRRRKAMMILSEQRQFLTEATSRIGEKKSWYEQNPSRINFQFTEESTAL